MESNNLNVITSKPLFQSENRSQISGIENQKFERIYKLYFPQPLFSAYSQLKDREIKIRDIIILHAPSFLNPTSNSLECSEKGSQDLKILQNLYQNVREGKFHTIQRYDEFWGELEVLCSKTDFGARFIEISMRIYLSVLLKKPFQIQQKPVSEAFHKKINELCLSFEKDLENEVVVCLEEANYDILARSLLHWGLDKGKANEFMKNIPSRKAFTHSNSILRSKDTSTLNRHASIASVLLGWKLQKLGYLVEIIQRLTFDPKSTTNNHHTMLLVKDTTTGGKLIVDPTFQQYGNQSHVDSTFLIIPEHEGKGFWDVSLYTPININNLGESLLKKDPKFINHDQRLHQLAKDLDSKGLNNQQFFYGDKVDLIKNLNNAPDYYLQSFLYSCLGLDNRFFKLMKPGQVGYLMAMSKLVNPLNKENLTVISGASGPSISEILLNSGGATNIVMIDSSPCSSQGITTNINTDQYVQQRYLMGGAVSGTTKLDNLERKLFRELNDIGVPTKNVKCQISKSEPRIVFSFKWKSSYHKEEKDFTVTLYHSTDLTNPAGYPKSLQDILSKKIDLFYMKAAINLPREYGKFLEVFAQALNPGGWMLLPLSDKEGKRCPLPNQILKLFTLPQENETEEISAYKALLGPELKLITCTEMVLRPAHEKTLVVPHFYWTQVDMWQKKDEKM